ncbi:MAG: hypothetical protein ABEN55_03020, partial [Bradymonadaceae bacterium]
MFINSLVEDVDQTPPLLVLATVRSDILAERDRRAAWIEDIEHADPTERIDLNSLAPDDHRALIDRLLALEDDLSAQLANRTEGNPLFAVQLLADWLDRDLVEIGEEGFRLADRTEAGVPTDIHELWMGRLERLAQDLDGDSDETLAALELTAALGREIEADEWRALLNEAELAPPVGLVGELIERGLADRTDEGWAFGHGLLVDSLQRRAENSERWADHHDRCARMLEAHPNRLPQETAARRADHWIEAGELERALEPLLEEDHRLEKIGDHQRRSPVLQKHRNLLDTLGIGLEDPRSLENDLQRLGRAFWAGEEAEVIQQRAQKIFERARRASTTEHMCRALLVAGSSFKRQREFSVAKDKFR